MSCDLCVGERQTETEHIPPSMTLEKSRFVPGNIGLTAFMSAGTCVPVSCFKRKAISFDNNSQQARCPAAWKSIPIN